MRALRTHRVLSRRVFRYYYHCLRPLAYAKGGSGRLTVMAGFNDGWLEELKIGLVLMLLLPSPPSHVPRWRMARSRGWGLKLE